MTVTVIDGHISSVTVTVIDGHISSMTVTVIDGHMSSVTVTTVTYHEPDVYQPSLAGPSRSDFTLGRFLDAFLDNLRTCMYAFM